MPKKSLPTPSSQRFTPLLSSQSFTVLALTFRSSGGKESTLHAGNLGLISRVGKIPWRRDRLPTPVFFRFCGGSESKRIRLQCGRCGFDPRTGKIPWRWTRLPYSCLENPQGQRSLAGYSLWSHKKSDTTKHSTALTFSSMT